LTTKIHAVVDANGNPVALKLSEGQAHDGRSANGLLDTIGEGQILLADRGTTVMPCARRLRAGAPGATSSRCRTG
jgi:transposase